MTLAPWKKSYDQLDSILKSKDITLLTKVHLVKAMVFPVVMYGCESWTIKKAECQRIDAFELCWWWFSFSVVSDSCNHMDCHQAPLSMEPSRQKHRSGLPFPSLPLTCSAGENLKSLLDSKEIKPVNPKGNQP